MRVVPVIDLKQGRVVRGIAGRRAEYQAVTSTIAADARPATVARAFVERLGLDQAYVADLDAISGATPAWEIYRDLAASGLKLWIDAGITNQERARELVRFANACSDVTGLIAGLESLPDRATLVELVSLIGPERLIFSVDLQEGRPLTTAEDFRSATPIEIATMAVGLGVRRLIVLDLARVGVGEGIGTEALCRELRALAPTCELIAGGGVRGADDLDRLAAAGCNAALVASVLHDGRLGRQELVRFA